MTFEKWWNKQPSYCDYNTANAAWKAATLSERERCAEICDRFDEQSSNPMNFAHNCAEAIRRGK